MANVVDRTPDASQSDAAKTSGPLLTSIPLLLALACTALFAAASWWSWRAGTLLDPLAPSGSVSSWDRLTSPLEWNAFQRLPLVTGDVDGTFAVGQHVWAVGATGLILHSADGGRTWERQDDVRWAPQKEQSPSAAALRGEGAESFGFVGNAYAMEPSSPSRARAKLAPAASDAVPPDAKGSAPPLSVPAASPPDDGKSVAVPDKGGKADRIQGGDAAPSNPAMQAMPEGPKSPTTAGSTQQTKTGSPIGSAATPTGKKPSPAQGKDARPPTGKNPAAPAPVETKTAAPPGPVDLHAVAFADEREGVIVGDGGMILRTRDGGQSWSAVERPQTAPLRGVGFADTEHAFAVGDGGALRSDDGGVTWAAMTGVLDGAHLRSVACAASNGCLIVADGGAVVEISTEGKTRSILHGLTNLRAAVSPDGDHIVAVGPGGIVRGQRFSRPELIPIDNVGELTSVRFSDAEHGVTVGSDGSSGVVVRTVDGGKTWIARSAVTASRLTSVAIVDAKVMVAVGTNGTVLRSTDGGVRWTSVVRGTGATVAVAFADSDHAVAVGTDGTILRSDDRGRTWEPDRSPTAGLTGIGFASARRGAAVGLTGFLHSEDGGEHWNLAARSEPGTGPYAVAFADTERAAAVDDDGAVFRTGDGGKTWLVNARTRRQLTAIAFGDPHHAVAVGAAILLSADGGATWKESQPNDAPGLLQAVAFAPASPRRAIAVGATGAIFRSGDGGESWRRQSSGGPATLRSVAFADSQRAVIVGDSGTIMVSSDGGETWTPKSAPRVHLFSVAFGDREHGIAVGEGGTIIASRDGGETWTPIRYARYPAPLFLVLTFGAIVLGLAWAIYARSEPPVEQRKASVTDLLGSDRPLRPGEHGAARLGHIAAGISRFIRNRNTQPPLTIAITGEWGTGKSSLMSLLYDDLEGRGFRPVWFNAWHHQHGEQLLASLYANIRAQGIPPFFSLEGLDFRYDLLRIRARRSWVRVALMLLGMGFALNYFRCHVESGQFLAGLVGLGTDKLLVQLKHVSAFAGVVGPVVIILQALRAFGVNPKTLLGAARLDRDHAVSATPGARSRFAAEFSDFTEALKPRPLVIFIDDLDRCSPENVLEVLETVNFLVSEGECYILLGLSRPWVEAAVGLGFATIAAETPDAPAPLTGAAANGDGSHGPEGVDPREKRRRFARHYLEKLVNIEVPVPSLDESGATDILTPAPPSKPRALARVLREAGRVVGQTWLPVIAIVTLVGGWYLAATAPDIIPTEPAVSNSLNARTPAATADTVAVPSVPVQPERPAPTGEGAVTPARFEPGATDALATVRVLFPAVLGTLALVTLVIVLIVRRACVETDDSADFRDALAIMRPWIILGHPTPRLLKRYVNHVRFIAMRQRTDPEPESLGQRFVRRVREPFQEKRADGGETTEPELFLMEPQLVALSALHQSRADWQTCPDWLQECYDKLKKGQFRDVITGREIEPKDLERVLGKLAGALTAYNGKFRSCALFVTEDADRKAITALIETMAGIRIEWTSEPKTTTSSPS